MEASVSSSSTLVRARPACLVLVLALSCVRLSHVNLLWADEDYHLAAALQLLHGKLPYRDFWYDKPPLNAAFYLLIGGSSGWPLRLLDALYVLLACYLAYRISRVWWGQEEGYVSAALLAFFMTFYLPSAVIPFAADALMLVPHLAAIYCALRKRAMLAGVWSGIAFLFNTKGLFVLAVCAAWVFPAWLPLFSGFAIPMLIAAAGALVFGAWPGYLEQVWRWGLIYAQGSPVAHPLLNGLSRTANWLGFHAVLAVGTVSAFFNISRSDCWKLGSWLALSFVAVCLGSRFAPHYFLQLLPPTVIAASRGLLFAFRTYGRRAVIFAALLLLVPLVRFAPHYVSLTTDDLLRRPPHWSDVVMDLDSREAACQLRALAKPGDTLFVWGYRPDLYVYTRMVPDGLFSDSQPLTGVPADRHLSATTAIYSGSARANREKLVQTHPTWLVDGLGRLNPKLKPSVYPELLPWLAKYKLVGQTKLSLIYRRVDS